MSIESLVADYESIYETPINKTDKPLEVVVCLRCDRPLMNEKSRLARLSPRCARKLAYETRTHSFSPKTLQHHQSILNTSHTVSVPTQAISLYYNPNLPKKPYCKIGTVLLPATDSCTTDSNNGRKTTHSLPLLFEGVIYEIGICLPQVRMFLLQVQDQQLRISVIQYIK